MESTIQRLSRSLYVVIGPEGATNFGIIKANDGCAVLVDLDIERIDEIEEALKLTGCANFSQANGTESCNGSITNRVSR